MDVAPAKRDGKLSLGLRGRRSSQGRRAPRRRPPRSAALTDRRAVSRPAAPVADPSRAMSRTDPTRSISASPSAWRCSPRGRSPPVPTPRSTSSRPSTRRRRRSTASAATRHSDPPGSPPSDSARPRSTPPIAPAPPAACLAGRPCKPSRDRPHGDRTRTRSSSSGPTHGAAGTPLSRDARRGQGRRRARGRRDARPAGGPDATRRRAPTDRRLRRAARGDRGPRSGVFVEAPERDAALGRDRRSVRRSACASVLAFDPGPPPAAAARRGGARDRRSACHGGVASSARSADQTAAALFWVVNEPADFASWVKGVLEARKLDTSWTLPASPLDAADRHRLAIIGTIAQERYLHWRPEARSPVVPHADRRRRLGADGARAEQPAVPSTGATAAGSLRVELPRPASASMARSVAQQRDAAGRGAGRTARRSPTSWARVADLGRRALSAAPSNAGRRVGRQVAREILERQLLRAEAQSRP